LRAEEVDVFALSAGPTLRDRRGSLARNSQAITLLRRQRFLEILRSAAVWFDPVVRVTDCRDAKDNKYLELALVAGAETIVSGDF